MAFELLLVGLAAVEKQAEKTTEAIDATIHAGARLGLVGVGAQPGGPLDPRGGDTLAQSDKRGGDGKLRAQVDVLPDSGQPSIDAFMRLMVHVTGAGLVLGQLPDKIDEHGKKIDDRFESFEKKSDDKFNELLKKISSTGGSEMLSQLAWAIRHEHDSNLSAQGLAWLQEGIQKITQMLQMFGPGVWQFQESAFRTWMKRHLPPVTSGSNPSPPDIATLLGTGALG